MSKFNNFERLIALLALSNKTGVPDEYVDPEKVAKWVATGNEWALCFEYEWAEKEDHPLNEAVEETCLIFEMFRHIQNSKKNFGDLNDNGLLDFDGFDANHDDHLGIAKVLVNDLERFTDVKNATTNSHSQASLRRYQGMLARYNLVVKQRHIGASFGLLDEDDLRSILGKS